MLLECLAKTFWELRFAWAGPRPLKREFWHASHGNLIFSRKSPCYLACQELQEHFSPERMLEAGNRLHTVEVLASKSSPGCAGARIKSQVLTKNIHFNGGFWARDYLFHFVALGSRKMQRVSHERSVPEKQLWNAWPPTAVDQWSEEGWCNGSLLGLTKWASRCCVLSHRLSCQTLDSRISNETVTMWNS